jgi:hypothetical protein
MTPEIKLPNSLSESMIRLEEERNPTFRYNDVEVPKESFREIIAELLGMCPESASFGRDSI